MPHPCPFRGCQHWIPTNPGYVELDINPTIIVNSPLYTQLNVTTAQIALCVRVDYVWHKESYNFHETRLTLTVDLAAGFRLVAVGTAREGAMQVTEDILCEVVAYFCDSTTLALVDPDPILEPGMILSVCVQKAPDVPDALYLDDIWETDLDSIQYSDTIIADFMPTDQLTAKTCRGGRCHIQSALASKWFDDEVLNITGVALCAFGDSSADDRFLYPELDVDGGFLQDAPTERNLQENLEWDIARLENFPTISFSGEDKNPDLQFRYAYTGTLGPSKTMTVSLFEKDCITPANSNTLLHVTVDTAKPIFGFNVFVNEALIVDSPHFRYTDETTAKIQFCARVDYNYVIPETQKVESQNFHETNVTLNVDLTAGFVLESVAVSNAASDDVSSDLYCSVVGFFCDDDNTPLPAPKLYQGDRVQFCVEYDPNGPFDLYVVEMLHTDLDNPALHSDIITDYVPDYLTEKVCEYGVCNIITKMTSKWFVEPSPPNVTITGYAICALGPAPTPPPANERALLMAVQRQQSRARRLQEQAQQRGRPMATPFVKTVWLEPASNGDDDDSGYLSISQILGSILLLVFGCCAAFCVIIVLRRWSNEEPEKLFRDESSCPSSSYHDDDPTEFQCETTLW